MLSLYVKQFVVFCDFFIKIFSFELRNNFLLSIQAYFIAIFRKTGKRNKIN